MVFSLSLNRVLAMQYFLCINLIRNINNFYFSPNDYYIDMQMKWEMFYKYSIIFLGNSNTHVEISNILVTNSQNFSQK